jgi:hypothetical protein
MGYLAILREDLPVGCRRNQGISASRESQPRRTHHPPQSKISGASGIDHQISSGALGFFAIESIVVITRWCVSNAVTHCALRKCRRNA